MTGTLVFTLLVEGLLLLGYAAWRRKPAGRLLLAGLLMNVATQAMLRLALALFVGSYLPVLFIMEACIWLLESLCLYAFPGSRLGAREAVLLSLGINAASLGLGWFLAL